MIRPYRESDLETLRAITAVCFDGVSWSRLPEVLRDQRPPGRPWRFIDGGWTRG